MKLAISYSRSVGAMPVQLRGLFNSTEEWNQFVRSQTTKPQLHEINEIPEGNEPESEL